MQATAIVAILFSPVVAVLISLWVQHRRERRQQKFYLLSTLIATRHEPLTPEGVRSLNMIDLVFHDKPKVRHIWHEYFDMLSNQGLNNELGFKQRTNKNIELITAMAASLGYAKAISHLDVDRVYSPVGFLKESSRSEEMQTELLRVLKNTAQLRVEIKPQEPEATKGV